MPFGKGRVVVFGEAAMLTAQNVNFGMNYTDERQLTLQRHALANGLAEVETNRSPKENV
jgi:hypothetical protein